MFFCICESSVCEHTERLVSVCEQTENAEVRSDYRKYIYHTVRGAAAMAKPNGFSKIKENI